jgi:ornithine cyclodeaminase/alanine dehydrogenase-like protein (mu-crystallin family)
MPLYLTEADVAELLTPDEAFAAVEASFGRIARGRIDNPPRVRAALPNGDFAVMPCVDHELGIAGLKTFAWLPGGTPFLIVLFSIEHARIDAIVEADMLGQLRTAAASAVAATHLARAGATTLGVLGCGRQAASHIAALRAALPALERVVVYCRSSERLGAFCADHGAVAAESAQGAVACDVVVAVTTASEPVVLGEWLGAGAFVAAVGASEPGSRELDDAVLERAAFVCCDSRGQSQAESGDLIGPVAQAILSWEGIAELHEVVAGAEPGRTADDDIVVFKSNGIAAWDIAAAARVVELARAADRGRELE